MAGTRDGIPSDRVVAVLAELDTGQVQIGSGYLVTERLVLTAGHCTVDKKTGRRPCRLSVAHRSSGSQAKAELTAAGTGLDVAVLEIVAPPWQDELVSRPPRFGRVDRTRSRELHDCQALGFPLWQFNPVDHGRNAAELHGTIRVTEDVESGFLVMRDPDLADVVVPVTADAADRSDGSPWGGLSGALVFWRGVALGIVTEHHPRQGRSAIRILPAERFASAVGSVLGFPAGGELPVVEDAAELAGAQRVRAADPQLLGVHKPIEVEGAPGGLPLYVPRDADIVIRRELQDAACSGGLVVLVGGSSVGKSRSAYEAARELFPDWWLVHPDPDDHRWLSKGRVAPTVVWLDELQRYFEGAHPLTSDQIRGLLRSDARVVMIGTLWPERHANFSAPPRDPLGPDPYRDQREVLELATVVRIADSLSDAEHDRARQLADTDLRLSAALRYPDYGLTQSIAAAPQLMERWRNAGPYAAAVLSAAIDARRVGTETPVTADFLRVAAPAYCDNRARATAPPDWFESALDYCTRVLHGAAAVLEPVASGMGEVGGYVVAEYLQQHAGDELRYVQVPEDTWKAVLEHVDDLVDLTRCGLSAERRLLYGFALPLYVKAARSGQVDAADNLASLLAMQGHIDSAAHILRRLTDSGIKFAHSLLINLLAKAGRVEELRERADGGDDLAAVRIAKSLAKSGHQDDGIALLRDYPVQSWVVTGTLAELLEENGEIDEAIQLLRGTTDDLGHFARLLRKAGREQELRSLAAVGDPSARFELNELLAERGDADELLARGAGGDSYALLQAAFTLRDQGREDESLQILDRLGSSGSYSERDVVDASQHKLSVAMASSFAKSYRRDGALLERIKKSIAITSYQRILLFCSIHSRIKLVIDGITAATDDDRSADEIYDDLARTLDLADIVEDSREAGGYDISLARLRFIDHLIDSANYDELKRLAVAGDDLTAQELVRFLTENGRLAEARDVIQERMGLENRVAGLQFVDWLAGTGQVDEIRELAASGDTYAERRLAYPEADPTTSAAAEYESLESKAGELDEEADPAKAEESLRRKIAEGDTSADQLARLMRDAGRIDDLFTLVMAGLPGAAENLIEAMRSQGRDEDAERLQRYGMDLQGNIAPPGQHPGEGPSILINHFEA